MKKAFIVSSVLLTAAALLLASGCNTRNAASTPASAPVSAEASSTVATEAPLVPFDVYKAALDKATIKPRAYALTLTGKTVQEVAGVSTTTEITAEIADIIDGEKSKSATDMTITAVGQDLKTSLAYGEGYQYQILQGEKYCQKKSWEKYQESEDSPMESEFLSFLKDDMRDAEASRQEDGSITLTAVISAQNIKNQLVYVAKNHLNVQTDALKDLLCSDPSLTCTVDKDGVFTDYQLTYSVNGTRAVPDINHPESTIDSPFKAEVELRYAYTAFGDAVTVPLPDRSEYTELPESDFSIQDILSIYGYLFDENGEMSEDFDAYYNAFVQQFGKDAIDNLLVFEE